VPEFQPAAASPLVGCTVEDVAAAMFRECMQGGPQNAGDCDDPLVHALWHHLRQFMLGACTSMADHLQRTRGLPAIILECRGKGRDHWFLRHAAVATIPAEEAAALVAAGQGDAVPILDAAGGGTFADRMDLYWSQDDEYRVVMAGDPACSVHSMFAEKGKWGSRREGVDFEEHIAHLPGLALRLGVPFDLRAAVAKAVESPLFQGQRLYPDLAEAGIVEWAQGTAPGPRP